MVVKKRKRFLVISYIVLWSFRLGKKVKKVSTHKHLDQFS